MHSKPFDLVLLDIMMPNMNGYEVLEQMKADDKLRHIPVIMISAVDEMDSVVRCIELGAEDYLPKPFNPTLLRARVGACLERKRLHDQVAAQAADLAAWNRTLEQRVEQQLCEIERVSRLKRFLSPQVAELILSSGDERVLESHRRAITVLFCDLRGFTAFSETTEPEEVMSVLREYHAVLGQLIHKHEGTVERFAGDAIMVLFNDPLPCSDPNMRAVQMAVEMRDQVGALLRNGASTVMSLASASALRMDTRRWGASASRAASTMAPSARWSISPPACAPTPRMARSSSMRRCRPPSRTRPAPSPPVSSCSRAFTDRCAPSMSARRGRAPPELVVCVA